MRDRVRTTQNALRFVSVSVARRALRQMCDVGASSRWVTVPLTTSTIGHSLRQCPMPKSAVSPVEKHSSNSEQQHVFQLLGHGTGRASLSLIQASSWGLCTLTTLPPSAHSRATSSRAQALLLL
jgi:hypothetical protein